ncbi:MAG: class I SAM-dependent methyltransferase [Persicimonas sp.]
MKKFVIVALALALTACSTEPQPKEDTQPTEEPAETTEQAEAEEEEEEAPAEEAEAASMRELLEQAAEGDHRSADNIARNEYRNPVDTLLFFGIERDMTVVELWPGGGWYTEVLAPALTEGTLIGANFAPKEDDPDHYRTKLHNAYKQRMADEEIFSNVEPITFQPPEQNELGEPGSADMVLTFRNTHSFISAGVEDQVMESAYEVLEPGGIFGVVQHRAEEGADVEETVEDGYVPEAYVIEKAEEAGFELVEKSDINANPADTKDHPEGVWTLPPSLRLGDEDREKYEEIGESDRMTLKFQKPAEEADEMDEDEMDEDEMDDE